MVIQLTVSVNTSKFQAIPRVETNKAKYGAVRTLHTVLMWTWVYLVVTASFGSPK